MPTRTLCTLAIVTTIVFGHLRPMRAGAQASASAGPPAWDVSTPRGRTRQIDFTVAEGTWTSVDVSRDGSFIVFDLLSHVYRMPASGGEAVCLTQSSGIASNFHPAFRPTASPLRLCLIATVGISICE